MSDEHVFRLPDDAKEFTQEDSRRLGAGDNKSRVDSNGAVKISAFTAEQYRAACPGELTFVRSILSESEGLAVLYQGQTGMKVRSKPGSAVFSFGFARRLRKLKVEIPKGWYAKVDAWVETKVEGIDGPCLIIDLRHRELVEIKSEQQGAAGGEQGLEKK